MVLEKDKVFANFDSIIIQCTLDGANENNGQGGSPQHILREIVRILNFDMWKKLLKDLNINRNIGILKEKYVVGLDYILNLDIIEARH